jgi:hypothetical protein
MPTVTDESSGRHGFCVEIRSRRLAILPGGLHRGREEVLERPEPRRPHRRRVFDRVIEQIPDRIGHRCAVQRQRGNRDPRVHLDSNLLCFRSRAYGLYRGFDDLAEAHRDSRMYRFSPLSESSGIREIRKSSDLIDPNVRHRPTDALTRCAEVACTFLTASAMSSTSLTRLRTIVWTSQTAWVQSRSFCGRGEVRQEQRNESSRVASPQRSDNRCQLLQLPGAERRHVRRNRPCRRDAGKLGRMVQHARRPPGVPQILERHEQ